MSSAATGRRRLSRSAEFERVYRHGRSRANRHLVLHTFPRGEQADATPARLGLSVSRRVGGSVQRNQVKRLLREAFRARSSALAAGHDYVIVARPEVAGLVEREGLVGVARSLEELLVPTGTGPETGGSP